LTNYYVWSLAISGTNLFAGTFQGVFLSTNNGTNWTAVNNGLNISSYNVLATSGTNIFAGTFGGVYLSTDNGGNWTAVNAGLENTDVFSLAISGTNIFAGTDKGVFLSTSNSTKWAAVNDGLTNTSVQALAISGTNIYAGTTTSVFRRPLSEVITSVERLSTDLPTHFSLGQNYPNPFNPSTTISFSLPSKSFVSLKVFDIIGREIAAIISEEMSAGSYTKQWNAANMSSGIYFYRLQAGSFTETKKLLLLR
jgi:ligand-binding sensor domain-containing protein